MKLLLALCLATTAVFGAERPNIVVILSDDFGYGSAGCYGADPALIQTPALDRLAHEGRRFTDASTTSSVCSPTRYSLITGKYCWRTSAKHGVLGVFSPLHIERTQLNMASMLKKHGYQTAAVGKWHLGYGTATDSPKWRTDFTAELSPGPLDIGFDYHFGVPANHGDVTGVYVENRYVHGLRSGNIPANLKLPAVEDSDDYQATYTKDDTESKRNDPLAIDAPRRVNERVMPVLTDKAIRFIEQQKAGTPFFLYFTPVAVHNPITPDKDLAGKSKAGLYGDWIHELDRSVGRILDTLDQQGLAKNTLVIFTSDNGGVTASGRVGTPQDLAEKAGLKVNGALRGRKHSIWRGGFNVPFLVRWPGHVPANSTSDAMISVADILATTAAIVGEPLPESSKAAEDSYNVLPAFTGDPKTPIRADMIVHSSDGVFAIRKGPWKWIEGVPVDETTAASRRTRADEFRPQLYNLRDDPAETKDVSAAHPEVVKELSALLVRYRDGGYSRELPPIVEKKKVTAEALAPLTGDLILNDPLTEVPAKPWVVGRGEWKAKENALWSANAKNETQGPALRAPFPTTDGVVQYELCFRGGNRHSLRVEAADRKQSFRIEVSRTRLGITKNPAPGEGKDKVEPLGSKPLQLAADTWYPLRVTFRGQEATAEIGGVSLEAEHAVLGQPKAALNFLVFGNTIGLRKVTAARR